MNVQVISIKKEHEPLLGFFYPTYSITDSPAVTRNFITHLEIKSKYERDVLNVRYENAVIISTQIFDEVWDEQVLIKKSIEFAKVTFHSRKTKLTPSPDTFVLDCVNFMFNNTSEELESQVTDLFESFGSQSFYKKFVDLTLQVPIPVLLTAMNTFLSKILNSDSPYYKKKAMLYKTKLQQNFYKALDSYTLRDKDPYGLSSMKFYSDLS